MMMRQGDDQVLGPLSLLSRGARPSGDELSTADIMMVYCLTTSRAFRGITIEAFPNLQAYLARIGARPAYQRAMAKAEPGMAPMLT